MSFARKLFLDFFFSFAPSATSNARKKIRCNQIQFMKILTDNTGTEITIINFSIQLY